MKNEYEFIRDGIDELDSYSYALLIDFSFYFVLSTKCSIANK